MHLRYIFVHNLYRINKTVKMFRWNNRQDKRVVCAIKILEISLLNVLCQFYTQSMQSKMFHFMN